MAGVMLQTVFDVPCGVNHEGALPFLGRPRLQFRGGRPLPLPLLGGTVVLLLFLLLVILAFGGGGEGFFIFGRHARSAFTAGAAFGPLAFFLAFFSGG